ncbi:7842_t:CDS:2 [Entrophospora sp. SA101]|nr:7842_t:CDS:2 [Entrophospora sp. SA101]
MSNQETIKSVQPTWQEVEKAIKEVVVAGLYYKKPKDSKFLKNYKKLYTDLHQHEEPQECIIKQAKTLFPNKEKYFQMKEQYKNWYNR